MPPKPDGSNGIEVADADEDHVVDNEPKIPLKVRLVNGSKNFIYSTRLFIYNKEKQTFFGNTCSSWMKIATYYFFFYVCCGLFYCGMVAVFAAIISRSSPRYDYHNSQLNIDGVVPIGLGFRPMPVIDETSITVYGDNASQISTTSSLRNYRIAYLTQYDLSYVQECSPSEPASRLQGDRSCEFSWNDIVATDAHPCSDTNRYGWLAGQPCILIKLNQIYNWTPGPGNSAAQVANFTGQPVANVDSREDNIYITCNQDQASNTTVLGNMTYYSLLHPQGYPYYGGIPYYFFPYLNTQEHVQPFVLVQFTSLPYEQTVNVECRAWAPNIEQLNDGKTLRGLVTFSLYRSNKTAPAG